ncbi:MAG: hypothetical protein AAF399_16030, partial [Bacteroidota bacterium]
RERFQRRKHGDIGPGLAQCSDIIAMILPEPIKIRRTGIDRAQSTSGTFGDLAHNRMGKSI